MNLDLAFIHRVYRTSGVLLVLGALLFRELFSGQAALGWLLGGLLSLGMVATVEYSVRRFISPEGQSPGKLLGLTVVKMLVAAAVLAFAFIAAKRGWLALLWVLPGFSLPYVVILLKLAGQKVRELTAAPDDQRADSAARN